MISLISLSYFLTCDQLSEFICCFSGIFQRLGRVWRPWWERCRWRSWSLILTLTTHFQFSTPRRPESEPVSFQPSLVSSLTFVDLAEAAALVFAHSDGCFCVTVLSMPDTVEEMCPEMPRLDKLLKDVDDVSESGARYSDMPQVRFSSKQLLLLRNYVKIGLIRTLFIYLF